MEADISVFVSIRRVDPRGVECWSSREFAEALGYTDFRNFAAVIAKVKLACLNSGQTVEDPFVDITEMVEIGSGAKVRQTIQELGGTMPEDLPTAESVKRLEARRKKELGSG